MRTNPNENYAREVLQLFSIGLNRLNEDGTPCWVRMGSRFPRMTRTLSMHSRESSRDGTLLRLLMPES